MMLLVDTSVWIAHFRHGEPRLALSLSEGIVLMHPWISGELACGNLKNRAEILADLAELPTAKQASDEETFAFLEAHKMWGRGLGWMDIHLLASSMLSRCGLWSLDKRLAHAAVELGIG
jgi:predicted nucleic acid-binding protein